MNIIDAVDRDNRLLRDGIAKMLKAYRDIKASPPRRRNAYPSPGSANSNPTSSSRPR